LTFDFQESNAIPFVQPLQLHRPFIMTVTLTSQGLIGPWEERGRLLAIGVSKHSMSNKGFQLRHSVSHDHFQASWLVKLGMILLTK